MLRRSQLQELNIYYDPNDIWAEDYGLWQKLTEKAPMGNIPQVLVRYRLSATQLTSTHLPLSYSTMKEIDRRNIKRFGLSPSDDTLQIHRIVGSQKIITEFEVFRRCERYLMLLRAKNPEKGVYPDPDFSNIIEKQWFSVCNKASSIGFRVWAVFIKSPLTKESRTNRLMILQAGI